MNKEEYITYLNEHDVTLDDYVIAESCYLLSDDYKTLKVLADKVVDAIDEFDKAFAEAK